MVYEVKIEFEEIYELLSSLTVFVNKANKYDIGSLDKRLKKELPVKFLDKVKIENVFDSVCYLYMLIKDSPHRKNVTEFLDWFEKLSVGEIYEHLEPYILDDFPPDLNSFRNNFIYLLSIWKEYYEIDQDILTVLYQTVKEKTELVSKVPAHEIVESSTKGLYIEPNEELNGITLIPSFHINPFNRVFFLKKSLLIFFSVDMPNESSEFPSKGLSRMAKAIGDEKRLRILHLVGKEPRTLTEIAKLTNMSKSNLHYHLTLLRVSGLVRILCQFPHSSDRYVVRPGVFESLKEQLEKYIL